MSLFTTARPKAPATLVWTGLDREGRPVAPGVYEIEVRGRLVPSWAEGFVAGDGIKLRRVDPDDRITVTRSKQTSKFIRFCEQNVFDLISRKLT